MVELSRITQDTTTSASEVVGAHGSLEIPDIEGGPEHDEQHKTVRDSRSDEDEELESEHGLADDGQERAASENGDTTRRDDASTPETGAQPDEAQNMKTATMETASGAVAAVAASSMRQIII